LHGSACCCCVVIAGFSSPIGLFPPPSHVVSAVVIAIPFGPDLSPSVGTAAGVSTVVSSCLCDICPCAVVVAELSSVGLFPPSNCCSVAAAVVVIAIFFGPDLSPGVLSAGGIPTVVSSCSCDARCCAAVVAGFSSPVGLFPPPSCDVAAVVVSSSGPPVPSDVPVPAVAVCPSAVLVVMTVDDDCSVPVTVAVCVLLLSVAGSVKRQLPVDTSANTTSSPAMCVSTTVPLPCRLQETRQLQISDSAPGTVLPSAPGESV